MSKFTGGGISQRHLAELYNQSKFCDVHIFCRAGERFQAHRLVLSVASSLFKNIFMNEDDKNEAITVINLPDVDARDLRILLQVIYLGCVFGSENDLKQTMNLAKDVLVIDRGCLYIGSSNEEKWDTKTIDDDNLPLIDENDTKPMMIVTNSEKSIKKKLTKSLKSGERNKRKRDTHPNLVCSVCRKVSRDTTALKCHMRRHNGEKPFVCTMGNCDAKFAAKADLINHTRVHSDEKHFVCDTCGRGFKGKQDLKRHMLIHGDQRPFLCDTCPRRFRYSQALKEHRLIHTGEKDHVCSECGRCFSRKEYLIKHFRRLHASADVQEDVIDANCIKRKTVVHPSNVDSFSSPAVRAAAFAFSAHHPYHHHTLGSSPHVFYPSRRF